MMNYIVILGVLLTTGLVNAEKPGLTRGIQETKKLAISFGAKVEDLKKKIVSILGKLAPEEETELTQALARIDPGTEAKFLKVYGKLDEKQQKEMAKAAIAAIYPGEVVDIYEILVKSRKHRKYGSTTPKTE